MEAAKGARNKEGSGSSKNENAADAKCTAQSLLVVFVGGRRRADNSTRNNSERRGKSGSRERGARCFIQPTSRARPEPEPSRSCRVANVHGRPVPARFPRAAMLGTRTVSQLQNGGINRAWPLDGFKKEFRQWF